VALTVGTATTASNSGGTTTTFSHTVASGTQLLVVRAGIWNGFSSIVPTGVTFNGTALSHASGFPSAGSFGGDQADLWYLVSPTVTTANVVVTMSASGSDGGFAASNVSGGVNTASPIGTTATNSNGSGSNNPSTSGLTGGTASGVVLDTLAVGNSVPGVTAGGTSEYALTSGGGESYLGQKAAGNASGTTWTLTTNEAWSIGAAVIKSAAFMVGTSNGVATVSKTLQAAHNIGSGTSAGVATVSATIKAAHNVGSKSAAGVASVSVTLTARRNIIGSSAGVATCSGSPASVHSTYLTGYAQGIAVPGHWYLVDDMGQMVDDTGTLTIDALFSPDVHLTARRAIVALAGGLSTIIVGPGEIRIIRPIYSACVDLEAFRLVSAPMAGSVVTKVEVQAMPIWTISISGKAC
jgi:hypothetical protein